MKDEFYFPSKDGNTEIHTIEWKPQGEVRAILQICHGMVEYMNRYDEFADFLCSKGFYVVGNDHLGHGKSVQSKKEYGFFAERGGNACVLGDIHTLRQRTLKKYPNIPYFILGHSMGSIFVRQYIQMYGKGLSGVIMIGLVSEKKRFVLCMGKILCRKVAMFKGWHHRSKLIDRLVIGGYNKGYKKARTRADWVTSDVKKLDAYVSDPLCSFVFTVNAYYNIFCAMLNMQKKENVYMIPKSLPILVSAGTEDPVGGFGKGVRKVYEKYKRAGIQDILLRLYAGDRHELLNESDRKQVYLDLYEWLEAKL